MKRENVRLKEFVNNLEPFETLPGLDFYVLGCFPSLFCLFKMF